MGLLHRRQSKLGVDQAAGWPRVTPDGEPKLRVLVEASDPAEADAYWHFLGRHGYAVSWCPGPTASHSCTLVTDGRCTLVEEADVVVTALAPNDPYARPVLEHLHDQDCMKPMIAVGNKGRWNGLLDRFKLLDPFWVRRDLLPALQAAEESRGVLRTFLDPEGAGAGAHADGGSELVDTRPD
jgi:hypothetical protein